MQKRRIAGFPVRCSTRDNARGCLRRGRRRHVLMPHMGKLSQPDNSLSDCESPSLPSLTLEQSALYAPEGDSDARWSVAAPAGCEGVSGGGVAVPT